jgi:hypothetical protein
MRLEAIGLAHCVPALLVTALPAAAFGPPPAERYDVFSPNRAFVLEVDPKAKMNTVYAAPHRAAPLWSFTGLLWPREVLLSNDGSVVAVVQWPYVREEDVPDAEAIWFISKDGRFRSYTVAELCPYPRRTQDVGYGPVGDSWRTWRTKVSSDGDRLIVDTTGGWTYEFQFVDGIETGRWWNSAVVGRWWFAAGVGGFLLVAFAAMGYTVLRHRRFPSWPQERRAIISGVSWFVGCIAPWLLATVWISDGVARATGSRGWFFDVITGNPRARVYLCGGVVLSLAIAGSIGVCKFVALRRGPIGESAGDPSESGESPR